MQAEYILKTRDPQILLTQWQAPAPKQCILVRGDSEDPRRDLRGTLLQPCSEFILFPNTISTFVVPSSIPSYSSPCFQCGSSLLLLHPEKGLFSSKFSCHLSCRASTVPATSPASLIDFIPFCTSSVSGQEYTASLKPGKNSTGKRGKEQERCMLFDLLCKVLALRT